MKKNIILLVMAVLMLPLTGMAQQDIFEKYSDNGKCVDLSGLKLTAETAQDAPVLYYYMEWLKKEIFSETVFKFDEMFSLENWNKRSFGEKRIY